MSKLYFPLEEKTALKRSACNKAVITLAATMVACWSYFSGEAMNPTFGTITVGVVAVGLAFWIWAMGDFGKSKGYPLASAAFGLLGYLGWFILLMMPDKWGREAESKFKAPQKLTW